MHFFHEIAAFLAGPAYAGSGAVDGGHDIVEIAPGLSWNVGIGQLVQAVITVSGIVIPALLMFNKISIRHAMQVRDIADIRTEQVVQAQRLSVIEDKLHQLPAIMAGVQRNYRIVQSRSGGMSVASPAASALKDEYPEDDALGDAILEAVKKVGER